MKRFSKIIALLMALVMVLPLAIACTKEEPTNVDTTVITTGNDQDLYDANGYLKDYIPATIDYGGKDIVILGWSDEESGLDFYDEGTTGAILSDEAYKRNLTVEDRLNVNFVYTLIPGNNANRANFIASATNACLMGNGDYDLIGCYSMNAASLAIQDTLADMSGNEDLHFDAPWWNKTLVEGCSIGDELYFCSGDIAPSTLLQTMVMQVNMDMIESERLEDPRVLVQKGEWTLENMFALIKDIYKDAGTMGVKDIDDTYGIVMTSNPIIDAFLTGSDISYVSRNRLGEYTLSDSFQSEKTFDLVSLLTTKMYKESDVAELYQYKIFSGNRSLIALANINSVIEQKVNIEFTYSVIPFPKYDEEQTEYKSTLGFPHTMYCIPVNAKDVDMSAMALECLASEGYRQLRPTIYETIKYQNSSEAIDVEMFDTIVNGITFDLGRIFHELFDFNASPVGLFRNCIINNNTNFYSSVAGYRSSTNKTLASLTSKSLNQ